MGLSKAREKSVAAMLLVSWRLPLAVVFVVCVLQASAGDTNELWRYDRALVASGDLYRLVSGHFVHLGMSHLALNLVGLLLIWYLLGPVYTLLQWLLVILLSIVVMDAGFWWLLPELHWYVGLSGLLHGLLIAGVVGASRHRPLESALIAAVVGLKLLYEGFFGPLPGSEGTAGGNVVTEAHLYGAIGGLAAGIALRIRVRSPAAI